MRNQGLGSLRSRKQLPYPYGNVPQLKAIDIPFPFKGINSSVPRNRVPLGQAARCEGVRLYNGEIQKAPGFTTFGTNLTDPLIRIDEYTDNAGVTWELFITQKKMYMWNGSAFVQIPKSPVGDLTGSADQLAWSFTQGTNFLFSQGADPVMLFTGGANFAPLNTNCPAASTGIGHQGRILIGNTIEGGNAFKQRVRWNTITSLIDWVGAGSGFIDFSDTSDFVTWLELITDNPVVFKERTVIIGSRTGLSAPAYIFAEKIGAVGTRSPFSVTNLGDALGYVGSDNIYIFDLVTNTPIGDSVRAEFFGSLNPTYLNLIQGYYIDEFEELRFVTPTGASTYNNFEWCWNVRTNSWTKRARNISAVGYYSRTTAVTWANAVGTWAEHPEPWNSIQLLQNYPTTLTGTVGGDVYQEDVLLHSADGEAFESLIDFGDIIVDPSINTALQRVELSYVDIGVDATLYFDFSFDAFNSYVTVPVTLKGYSGSGAIKRAYVDYMVAGENVSMRMRHEDIGYFRITGIRLWVTTMGVNIES